MQNFEVEISLGTHIQGCVDTLGIRLPVDFAIFYQIAQSTSNTESYSEGFTLIASILHKDSEQCSVRTDLEATSRRVNSISLQH